MNLKQQQKGFVLVLSLVLLVVMTLVGVSSMNSASMEMRATANAKQHHIAFNAAQSVLEFAVSGSTNLNFQVNVTADKEVDIAAFIATFSGDASEFSGVSKHAGCAIAPGNSLQAGRGLSYNFFEITGTAANATGTATSIQSQGLRYPAAACD